MEPLSIKKYNNFTYTTIKKNAIKLALSVSKVIYNATKKKFYFK